MSKGKNVRTRCDVSVICSSSSSRQSFQQTPNKDIYLVLGDKAL